MKLIRSFLGIAGFLAVFAVASTAVGQLLFDSWITYGVDKQPTCIVAADIDGDGDLDLIIGHNQGGINGPTVVVMENLGNFVFRRKYTLYPKSGVYALSVLDLDGNGYPDILTANPGTSTVDFFRNLGPGKGFALPVECRVGRTPLSVAAGELDNDNYPDVLCANYTSGTISIIRNRGAGTFPAESTKVASYAPRSLVLFDMDNDGDSDIAVSVNVNPKNQFQGVNGIVVFQNDTFPNGQTGAINDSARKFYRIPVGSDTSKTNTRFHPYQVIAADFDGDGYTDLAVADSAGTVPPDTFPQPYVSVFINNRDRRFKAPVNYPVGYGCRSIAAADVDKDGYMDIIAVNMADGTVSVLKNNGDGTFAPRKDFLTPNNPPAVIATGDFNGDGYPDLAVVSYTGATVALMRNKGNGDFEVGTEYSTGTANLPQGLAAGDLNGDGRPDVVVANQGLNQVTVHLNDGTGQFISPGLQDTLHRISTPSPKQIALADLDGDGDLDLAVVNQDKDFVTNANVVSIMKNNGSGGFSGAVNYPVGPPGGGEFPRGIVARDLNGDGFIDLAVADYGTNSVTVLMNKGDGTFVRRNIPGDLDGDGSVTLADVILEMNCVFLSSGTCSLTVADVNGDGVVSPPDMVYMLRKVFQNRLLPCSGFRTGRLPVDITAADFNGDGYIDLVTVDQGDNDDLDSVTVLFNDGTGAFPTRANYVVGSFPTAVATADFNGDGHPDIAVTVAGTGTRADTALVVLINKGDGTFTTDPADSLHFHRYLPAPGPVALTVGDMNMDGKLDIVTANSDRSSISFFAGNGDGIFAPAIEYGCGISPQGVVATDINGDGDLDLVVTNLRMVSQPTSGGFTVLRNLTIPPVLNAGGKFIVTESTVKPHRK